MIKVITSPQDSKIKLSISNFLYEKPPFSDVPTSVTNFIELYNEYCTSVEVFNYEIYVSKRTISPAGSSIGTMDFSTGIITDKPQFPLNQSYTALWNFNEKLYVYNNASGGTYLRRFDGLNVTSLSTSNGYSSTIAGDIENRIFNGISVGSYQGDGMTLFNTLNNSTSLISNNTSGNSGQGNTLVKFNGQYYFAGSSTSKIVRLSDLSVAPTKTTVDIGVPAFSTTNDAVGSIATTQNKMVVAFNGSTVYPNSNRIYSVFNGTTWTPKTLPANVYFTSYLQNNNYINNEIFAFTYNKVTKMLSIYVFDETIDEFIFRADIKNMSAFSIPNDFLYIPSFSRRYNGKWYAVGYSVSGATVKFPFIMELQ